MTAAYPTLLKPRALSTKGVERQINDFVNAARLSKLAGYDGVEVMGSEGYFINQFLCERTNKRTDKWGGPYENRMRLPVEIVRRMREAVGPEFIIIYRLSMLDLVEGGQTWDQIVTLGKAIEKAGATIINTGIGWHEARVPTIVTSVPRGGFADVTAKFYGEVDIPICTTNRINTPEKGEEILAAGKADMVSMARPLLAERKPTPSPRKIYLMQRKTGKVGGGLGKTSGWVHRNSLKHRDVDMLRGCSYDRIDDEGLHISFRNNDGKVKKRKVLGVDNVIICAGQEPYRELFDQLAGAGVKAHLIGGADVAEELDAKRAIRQGTEVAASI